VKPDPRLQVVGFNRVRCRYTVDWVHLKRASASRACRASGLKLNDQAQRTILCNDPYRAHDRIDKLIVSM
jgi:proteasome accessory factor A